MYFSRIELITNTMTDASPSMIPSVSAPSTFSLGMDRYGGNIQRQRLVKNGNDRISIKI